MSDGKIHVTFDQVTTVETADYDKLSNKPQIESVELTGNISFDDLGLNEYIDEATAGRYVEVESGKGLSEENYTSTEKTKLAGIAEGAEANVNADWDATEGDAVILNKPTIPSKTSDLTNDSGFITGYTETDPTVPSWAKQPNKPTYTASEVGALPDTTVIPTKTSDLTNDSGFITGYTETDPTVPAWAKAQTKPSYSYSEISGTPTLAAVATSGNYADLTGKPTIPTVDTTMSGSSTNAIANSTVKAYIDGLVGDVESLLAAI